MICIAVLKYQKRQKYLIDYELLRCDAGDYKG
jgi:hypothetical protein